MKLQYIFKYEVVSTRDWNSGNFWLILPSAWPKDNRPTCFTDLWQGLITYGGVDDKSPTLTFAIDKDGDGAFGRCCWPHLGNFFHCFVQHFNAFMIKIRPEKATRNLSSVCDKIHVNLHDVASECQCLHLWTWDLWYTHLHETDIILTTKKDLMVGCRWWDWLHFIGSLTWEQ